MHPLNDHAWQSDTRMFFFLFMDSQGTVNGTFYDGQVFFRAKLQLVADPLTLCTFFPHKFRVCSRAIFCRISSRSSGVTGTRRTIFRVRFVIVSPRFLGVWGTPQQAFLQGVATLPMLATLPLPTTMTPQHPRFARKIQKIRGRFLHPLNDHAWQSDTRGLFFLFMDSQGTVNGTFYDG